MIEEAKKLISSDNIEVEKTIEKILDF